MEYIVEKKLANFEFWYGADDFIKKFTYSQLDSLDEWLTELYADSPHPPSETEINDFFRFCHNEILQHFGFDEACKIILHGEPENKIEEFIEWYKADENNDVDQESIDEDAIYEVYHYKYKNQR